MNTSETHNRITAILLAAVMLLTAAGHVPEAAYAAAENASAYAETENAEGGAESAEPQPADTAAAVMDIHAEENPTGTVTLEWDPVGGAAVYKASSPAVNGGMAKESAKCKAVFSGLSQNTKYDFEVYAYDAAGTVIAQGTASAVTVAYKINFDESSYRVLSNRTVKAKKMGINLRKMIKEKNNGYAVVQGGCTDGEFAYYLMSSSSTQKGRILKVRIKGNKVVARSPVLNTWHGNGMTYDSKRHKLVVIAREHRKQEITIIDADTLRITRQEDVSYSYYKNAKKGSLTKAHQRQGLGAIAYVAKYDCYIALQRNYHNLLIFDPDSLEAIGLVNTVITSKYPGMYQAMDADEKYVYLLISPYYTKKVSQPYNMILALDWNSENLLPAVNASKSKDKKYIEKAWDCNNSGDGTPDAAIRIKTKREAENIYHTTDSYGRHYFYLSEYYGRVRTVTKKVKVRVKWKKVKRNGKKVWKYKTRYKKRKVKIPGTFLRDDYVYKLGII